MFGEKELMAIIEEYKQLNELEVFKPLDVRKLSSLQKANAPNAMDLIKEKWCGKIKGGTAAHG